MTTQIHSTAIVEPGAILGADVVVGPYAIVGARAEIGARTILESHAIVRAGLLGEDCRVHSFAVLGGDAQTRRDRLPPTRSEDGRGKTQGLVIGNRVEIREHVTMHLGTIAVTQIGDDGLFMAGCHVAHDCILGRGVTVANAVQLAGHVVVGDHVTFGGLAAVGQWLHVGDYAFVAGGALCESDVPPYVVVQGDRARLRAVNRVGLLRHGFSNEIVRHLEAVVRAVSRKEAPRSEALRPFLDAPNPEVRALVAALLSERPPASRRTHDAARK